MHAMKARLNFFSTPPARLCWLGLGLVCLVRLLLRGPEVKAAEVEAGAQVEPKRGSKKEERNSLLLLLLLPSRVVTHLIE